MIRETALQLPQGLFRLLLVLQTVAIDEIERDHSFPPQAIAEGIILLRARDLLEIILRFMGVRFYRLAEFR